MVDRMKNFALNSLIAFLLLTSMGLGIFIGIVSVHVMYKQGWIGENWAIALDIAVVLIGIISHLTIINKTTRTNGNLKIEKRYGLEKHKNRFLSGE